MIRDDVTAALTAAMKAREAPRVAAIRLIQAAIKNRDIEARTGKAPADDDALVVEVLNRMAKQRRESIEMFRAGGRTELADAEAAELAVVEGFLPRRLDEAETAAAIEAAVAETGASGPKDMGRVIAALKERHGTALDMGRVSGLVKARLAN